MAMLQLGLSSHTLQPSETKRVPDNEGKFSVSSRQLTYLPDIKVNDGAEIFLVPVVTGVLLGVQSSSWSVGRGEAMLGHPCQ